MIVSFYVQKTKGIRGFSAYIFADYMQKTAKTTAVLSPVFYNLLLIRPIASMCIIQCLEKGILISPAISLLHQ